MLLTSHMLNIGLILGRQLKFGILRLLKILCHCTRIKKRFCKIHEMGEFGHILKFLYSLMVEGIQSSAELEDTLTGLYFNCF